MKVAIRTSLPMLALFACASCEPTVPTVPPPPPTSAVDPTPIDPAPPAAFAPTVLEGSWHFVTEIGTLRMAWAGSFVVEGSAVTLHADAVTTDADGARVPAPRRPALVLLGHVDDKGRIVGTARFRPQRGADGRFALQVSGDDAGVWIATGDLWMPDTLAQAPLRGERDP